MIYTTVTIGCELLHLFLHAVALTMSHWLTLNVHFKLFT